MTVDSTLFRVRWSPTDTEDFGDWDTAVAAADRHSLDGHSAPFESDAWVGIGLDTIFDDTPVERFVVWTNLTVPDRPHIVKAAE